MTKKPCYEGVSRGLKTCLDCPTWKICDIGNIVNGAKLLRATNYHRKPTDWALKFADLYVSFKKDNKRHPLNQKQRNDFHDCLCCIMKELQEINETAGTKA